MREIVDLLAPLTTAARSASSTATSRGRKRKSGFARALKQQPPPVPVEVKKQILWKLISAELFERFLGTKYLGQKRFSIEGNETVIALLDQLIESAAPRGVDDITIGMAHRGRLNVIANVIGKFCERIFTSFEGSIHPELSSRPGRREVPPGRQRRARDGRRPQVSA